MDEEADAGNHQHHDAGKRVEQISPVGGKAYQVPGTQLHLARREPFEKNVLRNAVRRICSQQLRHRAQREGERHSHTADAEHADRGIGKPPAHKKHQRRRYQRKQRDEPQVLEEKPRWRHANFFPCIVIS